MSKTTIINAPPIENLSKEEKLKHLHNLIINSNEINKVLELKDSINIFKILRAETAEIKHSNVLAWLLESSESHKLSDSFLNTWVAEIISTNWKFVKNYFTIEKFLLNSNDTFTVYRERWNIDILLVSEHNKQVIVIENKIKSLEHGKQLVRYESKIDQEYPDFEKLFIYLTPSPSDVNNLSSERWIIVGYETIINSISNIINKKQNIEPAVELILDNYIETIRSEVMQDDTEIKRLSLEIYKKYRTALDIIFEYKPDDQQNMKDLIDEVLTEIKEETNKIVLLPSVKSYIRFTTIKLHDLFDGYGNEKWIKGMKELLVLEIINRENDKVDIKLLIGPSDNEEFRESLVQTAKKHSKVFPRLAGRAGKQYTQLYRKNILKQDEVSDFLSDINAKSRLKKTILNIINNDITKIENALSTVLMDSSNE